MAKRNRIVEARIIDALRAWPAGDRPTMKSLARAVNQPHMLMADTVRAMRYGGMIDWDRLELSPSMAVANDAASASAGGRSENESNEISPAEPALAIPLAPLSGGTGQAGDVTTSPASLLPVSSSASIAEQVKAEASAIATRRHAARCTGSVHSGARLSIGAQVQMERLSDGPAAGLAVLREAWPETLSLLQRLAARTGERPIPLIVRLIREAAAEQQLRMARDANGGMQP